MYNHVGVNTLHLHLQNMHVYIFKIRLHDIV